MKKNFKKNCSSKSYRFCQCGRFDNCTCNGSSESYSTEHLKPNGSRKLCAGDNNCYCNLKPIRPTLRGFKSCMPPLQTNEKGVRTINKKAGCFRISNVDGSGDKTSRICTSPCNAYQQNTDYRGKSSNGNSLNISQSYWDLRNNSSSISAVLHPDVHSSSESDSTKPKFLKSKCGCRKCAGGNNCYCNLKPIRPTLLRRPKPCIPPLNINEKRVRIRNNFFGDSSDDESGDKNSRIFTDPNYDYLHQPDFQYTNDRSNYEYIHKSLEEDKMKQLNSMDVPLSYNFYKPNSKTDTYQRLSDSFNFNDTCPCCGKPCSYCTNSTTKKLRRASKNSNGSRSDQNLDKYESESKLLDNLSQKNKKAVPSSGENFNKYGSESKLLDNHSQKTKNTLPPSDKNLNKYDDSETELLDNFGQKTQKGRTQQTRQNGDLYSEDKEQPSKGVSAEELGQFRKDNYFETHSTEKLLEVVPDHVCIHKFKLTDRLYPEPIDGGPYGLSKCMICGKLMKHENIVNEDQRFNKNKLPKYYAKGLQPIKINIGSGNNKIYVTLTEKEAYLLQEPPFKLKKPEYTNTYALRFQKGVI